MSSFDIEGFIGMSSEDALRSIFSSYPVDSEYYWMAFDLLSRRTWKRSDRIKIAKYYLKKMPFSGPKIYDFFSNFISVRDFIYALDENMPREANDRDLVFYFLLPILMRRVRTDKERVVFDNFLKKYHLGTADKSHPVAGC